ncbi:MAG: glycosyltransferase family 2 protein [Elusimicrobia bacterium]|nr:glycosyltransferase family 2 protein [Elusimicrobiota bacterium]
MAETLSVVVPALNEQENIEATVRAILAAAKASGDPPLEILVFDDGSTDKTGAIIDRLGAADARIRPVHNGTNKGMGFNYFKGVELATREFVLMVPGDNEIPEAAIRAILGDLGKADLVIPYMLDSSERPLARRVVSRAFVVFMNVLFGLRLRYYNGPCLLRTALVRDVRLRTHGFAYMAAILTILLKKGATFREVGIPLQYRRKGSSKAVRLKNVFSVIATIWKVWIEVYLGS